MVRVKSAWALGELGALRAIFGLWRAAHPGYPILIRRAALEAIVRIDRFDLLPAEEVYRAASVDRDAGIRKYHYIFLGRLRHPAGRELLAERARTEGDFFARRAAEFALATPGSLLAMPATPTRHASAPLLPSRTRTP